MKNCGQAEIKAKDRKDQLEIRIRTDEEKLEPELAHANGNVKEEIS